MSSQAPYADIAGWVSSTREGGMGNSFFKASLGLGVHPTGFDWI